MQDQIKALQAIWVAFPLLVEHMACFIDFMRQEAKGFKNP